MCLCVKIKLRRPRRPQKNASLAVRDATSVRASSARVRMSCLREPAAAAGKVVLEVTCFVYSTFVAVPDALDPVALVFAAAFGASSSATSATALPELRTMKV